MDADRPEPVPQAVLLPDEPSGPPGYHSEQDKQAYTLRIAIAGGIFFLGQFIVPFAVMMVAMPVFFFSSFRGMRMESIEPAFLAGGRLFYVTEIEVAFDPDEGDHTWLKSIDLSDDEAEVETVAELEMSSPAAFEVDGEPHIFSAGKLVRFRDGKLETLHADETMGSVTNPFVFDGKPAVVEETPDGRYLSVFSDGTWVEKAQLTVDPENDSGLPDKILAADDGLHCFVLDGSNVYHRKGLPGLVPDDPERWRAAARANYDWAVAIVGGAPTVFGRDSQGPQDYMRGYRLEGGIWKVIFETRAQMSFDLSVIPKKDGGFLLLNRGFPGTAEAVDVSPEGEVLLKRRFGKGGFPFFGSGFMVMAFVPHVASMATPLLLVLFLAPWMRRYRTAVHRHGDDSAQYASLTRRGCARLVDAVIMGAPTMAGLAMMMRGFSDAAFFFEPETMVVMFICMFGGMAWSLLCLGIFAACEAIWGKTPGKWLARIRVVGEDLRPCGGGAAIIRNLLLLADYFLNFLVGIMLVTLTEKWQRLGDMAARTVVVMDAQKTDI